MELLPAVGDTIDKVEIEEKEMVNVHKMYPGLARIDDQNGRGKQRQFSKAASTAQVRTSEIRNIHALEALERDITSVRKAPPPVLALCPGQAIVQVNAFRSWHAVQMRRVRKCLEDYGFLTTRALIRSGFDFPVGNASPEGSVPHFDSCMLCAQVVANIIECQ